MLAVTLPGFHYKIIHRMDACPGRVQGVGKSLFSEKVQLPLKFFSGIRQVLCQGKRQCPGVGVSAGRQRYRSRRDLVPPGFPAGPGRAGRVRG